VHAFATDPARGVFILIFLGAVIGGSLLLYALRAHQVRSTAHFELVSREAALLLNNVLLVCAAAAILLGTLYPLVLDALGIGKISVGPPYFNSVFIPLTIPLVVLAGIGALARWKRDNIALVMKKLWPLLIISVVLGAAAPWLAGWRLSWGAALSWMAALWLVFTTLWGVYARVAGKPQPLRALLRVPRGFYGMTLGHLGVAVFVVGVTMVSSFDLEKDVSMSPGDRYTLGGYEFEFIGVRNKQGPNYVANAGHFNVYRNGEMLLKLDPEKRVYRVQQNPMTEAAIDPGLTRDLYVSLGEPLGRNGAWSVRLYVKPFIRWIWAGALIMALGGLLAAADRRYRVLAARQQRAESADGLSTATGAVPAQ